MKIKINNSVFAASNSGGMYIKNRDEIEDQLTDILMQFDKELNKEYETDVYLYYDKDTQTATLDTYANVDGNSWIDGDHYTIYTDKPHYRGFWDFFDYEQDMHLIFGLDSSEELDDLVRGYFNMGPDERITVADYIEFVNNTPSFYNMIYETYKESIDEMRNEYQIEAKEILDRFEAGQMSQLNASDAVEESITASSGEIAVDPDILQVLLDNYFEPAGGWKAGKPIIYDNQPYLDKFMWLGFGCTYDAENNKAYVWWNPKGNQIDLPYEYVINSKADAESLCEDLYIWDEYNIDELLEVGLPLIGATKDENDIFIYEDEGLTAKIDTFNSKGTVTDDWGTKEYNNLQDLLEAADIIG